VESVTGEGFGRGSIPSKKRRGSVQLPNYPLVSRLLNSVTKRILQRFQKEAYGLGASKDLLVEQNKEKQKRKE
jgi:hypothetical protein